MTDREVLARAAAAAAIAMLTLLVFFPAHGAALDGPDPALTPGAVRTGALHAPRPSLSAAVVHEVARRYGIALTAKDKLGVHDPSCGRPRCEIDHAIPWGCRGASVADNLSYQTARAYPKKDRLEHWAERQVTLGRLSAEDCQAMFSPPNRWQDRYHVIFGGDP
jgi:hypothetical protein